MVLNNDLVIPPQCNDSLWNKIHFAFLLQHLDLLNFLQKCLKRVSHYISYNKLPVEASH